LRIYKIDTDRTDNSSFEEISDSNEIIAYLLGEPGFDTSLCERNLTTEQMAISHACLRMLEEHTSQIGFYFRYREKMQEYCEIMELRERVFMGDVSRLGSFIFSVFKVGMVHGWEKKATARGLTRYGSKKVIWTMSCEDLRSLENIFVSTTSDQEDYYFFGRKHPSVLDCTVFGHLSQFLYITIPSYPQREYLNDHCPALVRFMEHFRATHFPDWESLCERQPNEAMKTKGVASKGLPTALRKFFSATAIVCVAAVAVMAFVQVQRG